MECALSFSGNNAEVLREYRRILVPGGLLIVTDVYIREVADPAGISCLSATHCLAGAMTEDGIQHEVVASGFRIHLWQDQTVFFKQWLASMVFKLGSMEAFYRKLTTCKGDAESLDQALGKKIKLGYYLLIAEKEEQLSGFNIKN
jgi:SAM-dependent methyltransferase